jgi:hypothetical protein
MGQLPLSGHLASSQNAKAKRSKRLITIAGFGLLLPLIGSAFAATVTINSGNDIEFGQGTEDVTGCTSSATAAFESALSGSDLYISKVTVSSLNTACSGKYLKATLLNDTATLDTIVWTLSSGGQTGLTALANGTNTGTSLGGSTMFNYPASETGNAGLKNSMLSSSLTDILLETSDSAFTES